MLGLGLRVGVVPHGVDVHLAVHQQREVAGLALPGAAGLVVAEGGELFFERTLGKVVVALDEHGVVTLGDEGVVPGGSHVENSRKNVTRNAMWQVALLI